MRGFMVKRWVLFAACLAMPAATACTAWRPAEINTTPLPTELRLTLRDESVLRVTSVHLDRDSTLVGVDEYSETVSVPLSDIVAVEVRRFSAAKTFTLVGVSVGLGLPALYGLYWFVGRLCTGDCT